MEGSEKGLAEGEGVRLFPAINLGDILDNGPGSSELIGPVRIVDIQQNGVDSLIWLIDRERPCRDKSNQRKSYVCQPYPRRLSEIEALLQASKCIVINTPSNTPQFTDEDRINACASEKARAKLRKQLKDRDERFEAIRPIVCKPDGHQARRVSEVVSDPAFARQIDERARELQRSPLTLRRWINRYWTNGGVRSALFAGYLGRCGNPGIEKKQESKLGRSPRLFITQNWKSRGYPLSQLDKQRLAAASRLSLERRLRGMPIFWPALLTGRCTKSPRQERSDLFSFLRNYALVLISSCAGGKNNTASQSKRFFLVRLNQRSERKHRASRSKTV